MKDQPEVGIRVSYSIYCKRVNFDLLNSKAEVQSIAHKVRHRDSNNQLRIHDLF